MSDPVRPAPASLVGLIAGGTLDAELAALLWLLVEDGVPLIVTGEAEAAVRAAIASAVLDIAPERPWVVLDADRERPDAETLGATLRGGVTPALILRAPSLKDAMERLTAPPAGLPEDAVRRLGAVLVVDAPEGAVPRIAAAHYLRPIERDAQGHVQRRPPAVLATWDLRADAFEHFAWAITPELADRVDRSQADLEERQAARATSLARLAATAPDAEPARLRATIAALLASEPPREHAPVHPTARPSGLHSPLTDPHVH
ncbi:MAG: hypothetical protein U0869_12490 [Chloroflexota bacterium]